MDGDGDPDRPGVAVGVGVGEALAAAAAEALAAAEAQASSEGAAEPGDELGETDRLEPANGFELLGLLGEADGLGLTVGLGLGLGLTVGLGLSEELADAAGFTPGQTLGRTSMGLPDADA
jgi:hypothetical protein